MKAEEARARAQEGSTEETPGNKAELAGIQSRIASIAGDTKKSYQARTKLVNTPIGSEYAKNQLIADGYTLTEHPARNGYFTIDWSNPKNPKAK